MYNYNSKRKFSTSATFKVPKVLDNWYITGIMDAESTFLISIRKLSKYKIGWYVEPSFTIGLDKKDLPLLESIKSTFGGIGSIMRQSKDCYVWRVSSLKDLINTVIPHFNKFTLHTQKRADFELFKQIVEMINQKKQLTLKLP